jgi:cytochrome o ubiquinol oxidase subunit IV
MQDATASHSHSLKNYLIGFVLAVVLTVIPFGLAAAGWLPRGGTFAVIAVAAVVQVLVHLRYFLNLSFAKPSRDNVGAMAFTAVLIFLMVGGTLWIMYNLSYRHDM